MGQFASCLQLALLLCLPFGFAAPGQHLGGLEKLSLQGVHILSMGLGPFTRLGQPRAAVQLAGVAVHLFPRLGGLGQVAVYLQRLTVLVQPAAQGRPLADQGLVGDLDGILVGRDQPGIDQRFEDTFHGRFFFGIGDQLHGRHPAPGVLGALPQLGQAQEDVAGDALPSGA